MTKTTKTWIWKLPKMRGRRVPASDRKCRTSPIR